MITHLDVPIVRIHRIPKYHAKHPEYYYIIKDVDTTKNYAILDSLSEASRFIDEEGYILASDN